MKNKVLLITGSSGIAAETIKLVLQQGAKVFFIGRAKQSCADLKHSLEEYAGTVDYKVGDLTNPQVSKEGVKACFDKYGRIDALFNVAGISGRKFGDGPAHECTEEGWAITMNTNVTTQFRMCREVLKIMLFQDRDESGLRGTILNMASILGISPEPKFFSSVAYATSKGAIISMTKTMASYYAKEGIRLNAIAPGLALTSMSERASTDPEIIEFMKQKQPLAGSFLLARDVAEASVFLLSSQSKRTTGITLTVDGGWAIS